jgi:hypothetical protein
VVQRPGNRGNQRDDQHYGQDDPGYRYCSHDVYFSYVVMRFPTQRDASRTQQ